MGQLEINLRDLVRVVRKRKWLIIVAPIFMGLVTRALTEPPPPVYSADALLKITRTSTLAGLMTDLVSYSTYDNMATQITIVTSHPVMEETAYLLNLAKKGEDPQPAINYLRGRITAQQSGTSDILSITAKAPTREQAVAVVNTTAEVYIRASSAERDKQINETVQFVQKRLKEATAGLNEAEQALGNFQRANATVLYGNAPLAIDAQEREHLYNLRLADLQAAILALDQMQQKKNYETFAQSYLPTDDPGVRALADEVTHRLGVLGELQSKKAQLLTYQTERSLQVVAIDSQIGAEERRLEAPLANLRRRLSTALSDTRQLLNTLERQRAALLLQPELTSQLVSLQDVVKEKQELTSSLRKQLQDAEIQQRVRGGSEVTFVERATTARSDPQRSVYFTTLIGVLIGFLLGGVFAFVLESMDTSIGTIEDVEGYIKSNVLGIIPHIETADARLRMKPELFRADTKEEDLERFAGLVTHFDPKSIAAEAYRTLRTNLSSIMDRGQKKVILISSSVVQEGKTTSSANLSIVFAQAGKKTLLIDCDLRRPLLDRLFGFKRAPGLSDYLLGSHELKDCMRGIDDIIVGKFGLHAAQATHGLEYLQILPAGTIVDNPTVILGSPAMDKLLAEARRDFDVVILDVSPVLPVADAFILAPKIDGVILAYQIGRVARDVLRRSKLRIESVGGNVWGVIMNDIHAEIDYKQGDYQYYHYQYQSRPLKEEQSKMDKIKDRLAVIFGRMRRDNPPDIYRSTRQSKQVRVIYEGKRRGNPPRQSPVVDGGSPSPSSAPNSNNQQQPHDVKSSTDDPGSYEA